MTVPEETGRSWEVRCLESIQGSAGAVGTSAQMEALQLEQSAAPLKSKRQDAAAANALAGAGHLRLWEIGMTGAVSVTLIESASPLAWRTDVAPAMISSR